MKQDFLSIGILKALLVELMGRYVDSNPLQGLV